MTYRESYERGRKRLEAAGISEAALDAKLLLEHVCGTDRNTLLVHGDREVSAEEEARYDDLTGRRAGRIPLQHLVGVQEFMGLEFAVNEHVLIPRQDTEILVEEALRHLHGGMRVLDMCTGSGCILISLLRYSNRCQGVGADISPEALKVAEENAGRLLGTAGTDAGRLLGAKRADARGSGGSKVRFVQSDLFQNITGRFEFIVSNPPYVESGIIPALMPEVRDHEPVAALDGGADGLDFYRKIVRESRRYLTGGGMLFLEIGCDQGPRVRELMEQGGFVEIVTARDYAGLDRVLYGVWPGRGNEGGDYE